MSSLRKRKIDGPSIHVGADALAYAVVAMFAQLNVCNSSCLNMKNNTSGNTTSNE